MEHRCPHCGAPLPEQAAFCPHCAKSVHPRRTPRVPFPLRKKVLLAASLCERAHLHVWDEPLNYIDVISRIQIEELLLRFRPTIVFVEHDKAFCEHVATRIVSMQKA